MKEKLTTIAAWFFVILFIVGFYLATGWWAFRTVQAMDWYFRSQQPAAPFMPPG